LRREVVHTGRATMEQEMMAAANADLAANPYGMEIVELQIKHINYSDSVRASVIERMKSERDRIAKLYESEAEEEKNKILGQTRKEVDEIEGEREERSAEIRGQADAEVIEIYAAALSKSPEFYDFVRRLEAYKQTLGPGTRLILSTDNEFLRLLRGPHDESPGD
jgi:membrane protease subunit HflC